MAKKKIRTAKIPTKRSQPQYLPAQNLVDNSPSQQKQKLGFIKASDLIDAVKRGDL